MKNFVEGEGKKENHFFPLKTRDDTHQENENDRGG